MARVVVVGGGFGGLATAARLAKLKHEVTLLESSAGLGGHLLPVRQDGFSWDRLGSTMTLPAVVRDLFRKSGRPLEKVIELEPVVPGRRHVFDKQTQLDLPMGSRGDQIDAVDAALGTGGLVWAEHVDSMAPVWEVLRQQALEAPFRGRKSFDRQQWKVLDPRHSLHRVARSMKDERLRALIIDRHALAGQDARALPCFFAVTDYVERSFGRWHVMGGIAALAPALVQRMAERRVDVRTHTAAADVLMAGGRVTGVRLPGGEHVPADVVVWTAPRPPESLAAKRREPNPAIPAAMVYLGLTDDVPDLPAETLVHGDPLICVRTDGGAPPGHRAWTVEHRAAAEDVLVALTRQGIDVRASVVTRLDRSPTQQVAAAGSSRRGVRWQGWRTGFDRANVSTAVDGLFRVGASVHPGPGISLVGLGAAQVATLVGPA